MKQVHLRKIRIIVSVVFFASLLFLFLGIKLYPFQAMENLLLRLQFLPSLLRFMAIFFSITTLGFVLISLLTILFGRVYCSSICPLGTLQDIIIAGARIVKPKKSRKFHFSVNRKRIFRYSILLITVVFWISGSLFLVNLLDPFSNFGKITVSLLQPVYLWLHNSLVFSLEGLDVFILSPLTMHALPANVVLVSVSIFLTILLMAIWRGRLFCNTLCPVGSILSLMSIKPVFRIAFRDEACTGCKRCEWVCKAECLDSKIRYVDQSRCINCFNCFASCPNGGIRYVPPALSSHKKRQETPPLDKANMKIASSGKEIAEPKNADKRQFLLNITGGLLSIPILTGKAFAQRGEGRRRRQQQLENLAPASRPGMIPIDIQYPTTPPGSISHEHFTKHCIACYLCVGACPTKVIVPSFYTYGLKGFMQPTLDFHRSFCNYDCVACTEVCPTGAITRQTPEQKRIIQIGVVRFLVESCVVTVDRTDCGACSEHCPTKAVQMVRWQDGLFIPEITPSLCIGCGACEFACPTEPYKAIYVHGRKVHRTARAIDHRQGPREDETDDFPF